MSSDMSFSLAVKLSNNLVCVPESYDGVPADEASMLIKETERRFEMLSLQEQLLGLDQQLANALHQIKHQDSRCLRSSTPYVIAPYDSEYPNTMTARSTRDGSYHVSTSGDIDRNTVSEAGQATKNSAGKRHPCFVEGCGHREDVLSMVL